MAFEAAFPARAFVRSETNFENNYVAKTFSKNLEISHCRKIHRLRIEWSSNEERVEAPELQI
jgi:hypothetical protein